MTAARKKKDKEEDWGFPLPSSTPTDFIVKMDVKRKCQHCGKMNTFKMEKIVIDKKGFRKFAGMMRTMLNSFINEYLEGEDDEDNS